jgi:hypothetical protein
VTCAVSLPNTQPNKKKPSKPNLNPNTNSGKEWSYLRGGLTCLDRDYGLFHAWTHDIGTHVAHHLFPQV